MRQKTMLALFVLIGISTLIYKFVEFRTAPFSFQSRLLKFDPDEVTGVVIQYPTGAELSINQDATGWLATDGARGQRVSPALVLGALAALKAIVAEDMRICTDGHCAAFGVGDGAGMRIRLVSGARVLEDLILGGLDSAQNRIYLRFRGQKEVFTIPAAPTVLWRQGLAFYQRSPLMVLPPISEIDSIQYWVRADSLEHTFRHQGARWELDTIQLSAPDSVRWSQYWSSLSVLRPQGYADDFDELFRGELVNRNLRIWAHSGDTVSISCYYRLGHEQPFVLEASQRPNIFFASDSVGLFKAVFGVLDTLVLRYSLISTSF